MIKQAGVIIVSTMHLSVISDSSYFIHVWDRFYLMNEYIEVHNMH